MSPRMKQLLFEAIGKIDDVTVLNEISAEARRRASVCGMNVAWPGRRVQFRSRSGAVIKGRVQKVNHKTATVTECIDQHGRTYPRGYRVAFSLLELAQ
jgi:hypothetical protein